MVERESLGIPAVDPKEDEFNRQPFSRALASRLATLGNPEGAPGIGLNGKWGYGKSTVLNFVNYNILHELSDKVVLFEFNPWLFGTLEAILSVFYYGLAAKMDESSRNTGQKVGDFLIKAQRCS